MSTAPLENIYSFQSNTGLVIPDTSNVRAQVIEGLKSVFGAEDFCTDAETPNGLLIDALTQMIKDFIGITAQNVNGLNITTAIGGWLDALGGIFGIQRSDDDTDYSYRVKILQSTSRGAGFVQSVYNAIYTKAFNKVSNVVILSNGKGERAVLPNKDIGIAVDPHSVFISLNCDEQTEMTVAEAINESLSMGCGFHEESVGKVTKSVDGNEIVFYHPSKRYFKVEVSVNPIAYTGLDIVNDTKSLVQAAMVGKTACAKVTKDSIFYSIASAGTGIVPNDIKIYFKDNPNDQWTESQDIVITPKQYTDPSEMVIEVS